MILTNFTPSIQRSAPLKAVDPIETPFSRAAHLRAESACWGVLKPLSFELSPGKVLGVIGANGAGKSSLLKILYRLHKPAKGRIYLDGQDLHKLPGREAACRVAAVVQEQPAEFSLTVLEIIKLGLLPYRKSLSKPNAEDQRLIDWVLETLALTHLVSRQCHTPIGRREATSHDWPSIGTTPRPLST